MYSKTTFVTVNLLVLNLPKAFVDNSKTTFVTVNQKQAILKILSCNHSKTTFVTVNPSFLKALYFII